MDKIKQGMRRRLTRYGDDEFALFLRKSFIKGLSYGKLFHDNVVQAPGGVDFDFLQGVDPADADAGV